MLSFRFAGAFLLRLDTRTLSALLFHPPPRRTAWFGLALAGSAVSRRWQTAESNSTKHLPPQAIGLGVGVSLTGYCVCQWYVDRQKCMALTTAAGKWYATPNIR